MRSPTGFKPRRPRAVVFDEMIVGAPARPEAVALLGRLASAEMPLALACSRRWDFIQRSLLRAGLPDGVFGAVVSGEDVEQRKPAPDIYLEACRRLELAPSKCAAIEHSVEGVASAAAAGLFVIGIPYFTRRELPGSDLLAGSLADPVVIAALGLTER